MSDKWQKNQLVLAFTEMSRSEAPRDSDEGTESLMAKREDESSAGSEQLMEEVCGRKNCQQALARVKSNKGSAGIDGMTVEQLPAYLKKHWPTIREQLLSGTYKPQPVKRVEIPKPVTLPRCAFTVISLIPSFKPTCLFNMPDTANFMILFARRE